MLTAVTYTCDPESLGCVDPADFVTAFENEVRVKPIYRDLAITVSFEPGTGHLSVIESDDPDADLGRESELQSEFRRFAELAWGECLRG